MLDKFREERNKEWFQINGNFIFIHLHLYQTLIVFP
jgi:hypothetical protein